MPCAASAARSVASSPAGVKRSWSTPWCATTISPRGGATAREAGRRCTRSRTRSPSRACAAARIMRRKYTTLLRSCHSGWSKNVRSCMVTTDGTVDAQRHRVVRAVPHVGRDPCRELRRRAPAPTRAAPGRRAGATACTVGVRRERRASARCRRAGSARCRSTSARVRRARAASADRVDPGADRAGGNGRDVEEHAHARSLRESARAPRCRAAPRVRRGVGLGRVRPR